MFKRVCANVYKCESGASIVEFKYFWRELPGSNGTGDLRDGGTHSLDFSEVQIHKTMYTAYNYVLTETTFGAFEDANESCFSQMNDVTVQNQTIRLQY